MKKAVIFWVLFPVIFAIVIFYWQSELNKRPTTIDNTAVSNLSSEHPEYLSINQLPAYIQIKDIITAEYPIKIRPLSDKAILRVTNSQIVNQGNVNDTILKKVEIIDGSSIFVLIEYPEDKFLYFKKRNEYDFRDNPIRFAYYMMVQGDDKDYLAYSIDGAAVPAPFIYNLIQIKKENNQLELIKFDGKIITNNFVDLPTQFITVQQDNIIKLEEGKYIVTKLYNYYFYVEAYYEIVDTKIQFADKEFKILENNTDNAEYQKEQLKKSQVIIIYMKPSIQSASQSIKLSENTEIRFLGVKYTSANTKDDRMADFFTHVIIDGEEGWVSREDLIKLGIYPIG